MTSVSCRKRMLLSWHSSVVVIESTRGMRLCIYSAESTRRAAHRGHDAHAEDEQDCPDYEVLMPLQGCSIGPPRAPRPTRPTTRLAHLDTGGGDAWGRRRCRTRRATWARPCQEDSARGPGWAPGAEALLTLRETGAFHAAIAPALTRSSTAINSSTCAELNSPSGPRGVRSVNGDS
jgi:hypothetical protein